MTLPNGSPSLPEHDATVVREYLQRLAASTQAALAVLDGNAEAALDHLHEAVYVARQAEARTEQSLYLAEEREGVAEHAQPLYD